MVLTGLGAIQARSFYPDVLLQRQEQAPQLPIQCSVCDGPTLESCVASQVAENCTSGLICYSLQAFDGARNEFINSKGCFPGFLCSWNEGCSMVNASRGGAIHSCSLSCCDTPLCNAQAPFNAVAQPLNTTEAPTNTTTATPVTTTVSPTTTAPPTTTVQPTTTKAPTTTTAPPTTVAKTTIAPTTIPQALCGGPLTSPSGFFASPFYPLPYPNKARCVWSVTVPQGSLLRLNFLFFKTEKCYDFVEIYVGQRLVRRLSGGDDDDDDKDDDNKKADYDDDDDCDDDDLDDLDDIDDDEEDGVLTIHGTGEMIRILFRSDYSVTRRGFFVRYKIASPQLPAAVPCGAPLTIPTGRFTSPGFPGKYPNNADCRFSITVPLGSILVLNFKAFETERCRDYVQIMQGWRVVRRLSGVFGRDDVDDDDDDDDDCDDDDDDDDDDDECDDDDTKGDGRLSRKDDSFQCVKRIYIRGTGEMITIIFKSDQYFTRRGFQAVYHVIPGLLKR